MSPSLEGPLIVSQSFTSGCSQDATQLTKGLTCMIHTYTCVIHIGRHDPVVAPHDLAVAPHPALGHPDTAGSTSPSWTISALDIGTCSAPKQQEPGLPDLTHKVMYKSCR
jgi:hypothetical protein